ncbi:hypothetical protein GUJ93_ZPchr0010g10291 [Zizania palustris]|uniref:Uncharacterized protein n=1 Tax=Zizania palustris TaxID=103762 RepID=A0A8J6BRS6_ZIZPA|nr:hypothetical protein GUJ93_ZPchr0010g10291 [Zizania palustris]
MSPSILWGISTSTWSAGVAGLGFLETSYLNYLKLTGSEAFCPVAGGGCGNILESNYSVSAYLNNGQWWKKISWHKLGTQLEVELEVILYINSTGTFKGPTRKKRSYIFIQILSRIFQQKRFPQMSGTRLSRVYKKHSKNTQTCMFVSVLVSWNVTTLFLM